ncbi:MAG: BatA domain-containing protein [Reichenbachiella sp.]
MNFSNPTFLWALTALSIPVIIHLFNFRKAKLIEFSNVAFLKNVKRNSASKLQLKHILTLISRLLFIFFLVITFTQPYIPSLESGFNGQSVLIYLDNSHSMSNVDKKNVPAMEQARSITSQIIEQYGDATEFMVLNNDFSPESNFPKNKNKALDLIASMKYSNIERGWSGIKEKLNEFRSSDKNSDLFILSDFQSSTIENIDISDSTNQYHIIPITSPSTENIYVDSIFFNSPFIFSHRDNTLNIRFKNNGFDPVKDVLVKLEINASQVASITLDIGSLTTKTVSFEIGQSIQKNNYGIVRIEDFPITFDNDFYFSFTQASSVRIVEIKKNSAKTPVEIVFENNSLFDINSYAEGNIGFDVVENADLLIINGIDKYTPGISSQIKSYLQQNKTVLIIPGENTDINKLNLATSINITLADEIELVELNKPRLENPFFELMFESLDNNVRLPNASPIIKTTNRGDQILTTKSGLPFLSKPNRIQNLYLLTTPLTDAYTNFHKHALFVPILQRIAELSSAQSNQLYHRIGENNISINLDNLANQTNYKLRKQDDPNSELIPSQRRIANQLILDAPNYLLQTGIYEIQSNQQIESYIALNIAKNESALATSTLEEIKTQVGNRDNIAVFDSSDYQNFGQDMKEKYDSVELWKYALILSLMFLFIETLLLRFL